MSAKGLRLASDRRADLDFRLMVGELMVDGPKVILAEPTQPEGRVLIPRPDAGGASNDAPPAVLLSPAD